MTRRRPSLTRRQWRSTAACCGLALASSLSAAQPPDRWCNAIPRPANASWPSSEASTAWFQVYDVGDSVFAITEPFQFQEAISYLILGSERALLFDTGLGIGDIRSVVRRLTALPVDVLNSHTHYDHVGGNADFSSILAVDTRYTRANARGFPHRDVSGEVTPSALCTAWPVGFDTAAFHTRPWKASRWVRDGDVIDLGRRRLRVLQVPGHTPDAIALHDAGRRLLWTGDTFYEAPIWLYVPETNLAAYERSVTRLAAMAPRLQRVFGAHNIAASDPQLLGRLKLAIRQVRTRQVTGRTQGDQVEFSFGAFSLLTSRRALAGERSKRCGGSGLGTPRDDPRTNAATVC